MSVSQSANQQVLDRDNLQTETQELTELARPEANGDLQLEPPAEHRAEVNSAFVTTSLVIQDREQQEQSNGPEIELKPMAVIPTVRGQQKNIEDVALVFEDQRVLEVFHKLNELSGFPQNNDANQLERNVRYDAEKGIFELRFSSQRNVGNWIGVKISEGGDAIQEITESLIPEIEAEIERLENHIELFETANEFRHGADRLVELKREIPLEQESGSAAEQDSGFEWDRTQREPMFILPVNNGQALDLTEVAIKVEDQETLQLLHKLNELGGNPALNEERFFRNNVHYDMEKGEFSLNFHSRRGSGTWIGIKLDPEQDTMEQVREKLIPEILSEINRVEFFQENGIPLDRFEHRRSFR